MRGWGRSGQLESKNEKETMNVNRKLVCALGFGLAGWALYAATNEQVKASGAVTNGVDVEQCDRYVECVVN